MMLFGTDLTVLSLDAQPPGFRQRLPKGTQRKNLTGFGHAGNKRNIELTLQAALPV